MPATYEIDKKRRLVITTGLDQLTLADALAQPETADFEFDPPKIKGRLSKPADLS